jgi:hypothetical protein
MRVPFLSALLMGAAAPAAAPAGPEPAEPVLLAQLTIRQRIIVRVPRMAPAPVPVAVEWRERKGPACVPAAMLGGAVVRARDRIDLVLRDGTGGGGRRVRARLDDDCRGLDFYSGFYLRPDRRGMVCAGRDAIRGRAGAKCEISRFRLLEPVLVRAGEPRRKA